MHAVWGALGTCRAVAKGSPDPGRRAVETWAPCADLWDGHLLPTKEDLLEAAVAAWLHNHRHRWRLAACSSRWGAKWRHMGQTNTKSRQTAHAAAVCNGARQQLLARLTAEEVEVQHALHGQLLPASACSSGWDCMSTLGRRSLQVGAMAQAAPSRIPAPTFLRHGRTGACVNRMHHPPGTAWVSEATAFGTERSTSVNVALQQSTPAPVVKYRLSLRCEELPGMTEAKGPRGARAGRHSCSL